MILIVEKLILDLFKVENFYFAKLLRVPCGHNRSALSLFQSTKSSKKKMSMKGRYSEPWLLQSLRLLTPRHAQLSHCILSEILNMKSDTVNTYSRRCQIETQFTPNINSSENKRDFEATIRMLIKIYRVEKI